MVAFEPIYFDFDKSNLRPDAIEKLNKNDEFSRKIGYKGADCRK
jgi:outer membrane protein OmpA-like peptidoglycan-associated protein